MVVGASRIASEMAGETLHRRIGQGIGHGDTHDGLRSGEHSFMARVEPHVEVTLKVGHVSVAARGDPLLESDRFGLERLGVREADRMEAELLRAHLNKCFEVQGVFASCDNCPRLV